jgi:hypothetical protein|tara:strand:- start:3386 stop:3787 length:402 start_codon:yes stop_codon:yes gene_type:complete
MDKDKFEIIERFIDKGDTEKARYDLASIRKNFDNDPDYLYLMAKFLVLDRRYYIAIDSLILSLQNNFRDKFLLSKNFSKSSKQVTNKKIELLSKAFEKIENYELSKKCLEFENDKDLLDFLINLMPGLKPAKF